MATKKTTDGDQARAREQRERGGYDLAEEVTGLRRGTLHSMVSRRQIPHCRLGPRLILFERGELEAWIQANRVAVVSRGRERPL